MLEFLIASMLMQTQTPAEVRPFPKHVKLEKSTKDALARRITAMQGQPYCSAIATIPADREIDPGIAVSPSTVPDMPVYKGQEPCQSK